MLHLVITRHIFYDFVVICVGLLEVPLLFLYNIIINIYLGKKRKILHLRYNLQYIYKDNSIYNTDRIEPHYMLIEKTKVQSFTWNFI